MTQNRHQGPKKDQKENKDKKNKLNKKVKMDTSKGDFADR